MTQTPQVGDRITLTGTVMEAGEGAYITLDGGGGTTFLTPRELSQAKIEPRPLAVGDRVNCGNTDLIYRLECIVEHRAAISFGGILQEETVDLSDLTRMEQST